MLHDWRSYGEERRQALVEQDEANTSFYLNPSCPIARYFELAERVRRRSCLRRSRVLVLTSLSIVALQVVSQFRGQCANLETASCAALEDTYVMGHRLIAFLSLALPQHPGYLTVAASANRNNTFRDLIWINERMDEIALKIDEEQLNKFISLEFDPLPDDHDDEDDDRETGTIGISPLTSDPFNELEAQSSWNMLEIERQSSWESFPSWSACAADLPNTTDTDTSSFESELNSTLRDASDSEREDVATHFIPSSIVSVEKKKLNKEKKHVKFQLDEIDPTVDKRELADDHKVVELEDTSDSGIADECGVSDQQQQDHDVLDDSLYSYHDALHVSEFLRTIAEEDVRYENDSEANDSWAQDGDSKVAEDPSEHIAEPRLTCDPARLALREIMNKARIAPGIGEGLVERLGRQDDWAAFDFATVRQALI